MVADGVDAGAVVPPGAGPSSDPTTGHPSGAGEFVTALRNAAPYVHAHHGGTFVIAFPGETCASPHWNRILADVGLLASLGVRLVLVHGARPQIDAQLALTGVEPRYQADMRITDHQAMVAVKSAIGALRLDIEAGLASTLARAGMNGEQVPVVGGTWITARPEGVRDGIDFGLTGRVRRVDIASIQDALADQRVVLLSPLGFSPTGDIFNLRSGDVARAVAVGLQADKLIFVLESDPRSWPIATSGGDVGQFVISDVEDSLSEELLADLTIEDRHCVQESLAAARHGVGRVHLVGAHQDGALLRELYTRDGAGLMFYNAEDYESLRQAQPDDITGIMALLAPLEAEGVLVPRSREQLERDIQSFSVMLRDGMVIATSAVFDYPEQASAELACVAVHPHYRGSQRAETLLLHAEREARLRDIERLFVLTTQTPHWFWEHGFRPAPTTDLPERRLSTYNATRRSKVMIKPL